MLLHCQASLHRQIKQDKLTATTSYLRMALGMFYTPKKGRRSAGGAAMHCTACGDELILTNVVPENTVAVRGFEHHTFICSGCHSTVRRVVFMRHGREEDPMPPPGLFGDVMARVRGY